MTKYRLGFLVPQFNHHFIEKGKRKQSEFVQSVIVIQQRFNLPNAKLIVASKTLSLIVRAGVNYIHALIKFYVICINWHCLHQFLTICMCVCNAIELFTIKHQCNAEIFNLMDISPLKGSEIQMKNILVVSDQVH